ncbi:MAG: DUF1820 family protein [Gammaproteobacteria bacterium]|nr:MAG: DUF1820 family protein [Gammaproteobacteria bacterium]UCH39481.1 MAG: DUF1820 family protein [Gammaproteobacteria bacterium]
MSKSKKPTFRIQFHNNNKIYELYAHEVSQSQMAGFIEIGEIIFGEQSKLLIDPAEEKLKLEFANVKNTYIPHFAVIRIDEVERSGKNRILDSDGSSVTTFPGQASIPQKS